MPTTRRDVLGALAATAGAGSVAGCQTILPGDELFGTDLEVESVTVRPAVVAPDTPDSYSVFGARDEQFLVATVAGSTSVEAAELVLETDGGEFDVTVDVGLEGRLAEFGDAYRADDDTGWIAAKLPKPLDAEEATLAWDDGEYAIGESALERLNRPPTDFDVVLGTPQYAAVGDEVTLTVAMVNTGDVDGTLVAALNRVGPGTEAVPETAVVQPVGAGEYAEWEYTYALDDPEVAEMNDPSMQFHLPWRDGKRTREISVTTN